MTGETWGRLCCSKLIHSLHSFPLSAFPCGFLTLPLPLSHSSLWKRLSGSCDATGGRRIVPALQPMDTKGQQQEQKPGSWDGTEKAKNQRLTPEQLEFSKALKFWVGFLFLPISFRKTLHIPPAPPRFQHCLAHTQFIVFFNRTRKKTSAAQQRARAQLPGLTHPLEKLGGRAHTYMKSR